MSIFKTLRRGFRSAGSFVSKTTRKVTTPLGRAFKNLKTGVRHFEKSASKNIFQPLVKATLTAERGVVKGVRFVDKQYHKLDNTLAYAAALIPGVDRADAKALFDTAGNFLQLIPGVAIATSAIKAAEDVADGKIVDAFIDAGKGLALRKLGLLAKEYNVAARAGQIVPGTVRSAALVTASRINRLQKAVNFIEQGVDAAEGAYLLGKVSGEALVGVGDYTMDQFRTPHQVTGNAHRSALEESRQYMERNEQMRHEAALSLYLKNHEDENKDEGEKDEDEKDAEKGDVTSKG